MLFNGEFAVENVFDGELIERTELSGDGELEELFTVDSMFTVSTMFDGEYSDNNVFNGEFGVFMRTGYDIYTGEITVTPSQETQVLHTNGLAMDGDITINPIPNNYGLIGWNGAWLTVS